MPGPVPSRLSRPQPIKRSHGRRHTPFWQFSQFFKMLCALPWVFWLCRPGDNPLEPGTVSNNLANATSLNFTCQNTLGNSCVDFPGVHSFSWVVLVLSLGILPWYLSADTPPSHWPLRLAQLFGSKRKTQENRRTNASCHVHFD